MFGIDHRLLPGTLRRSPPCWLILAAALLLGLRHASDPDHLAAVTTLVAGGRDGAPRRAAPAGCHLGSRPCDLSLFVFGLPILALSARILPQSRAERTRALVGLGDRQPRGLAARPLAARPSLPGRP